MRDSSVHAAQTSLNQVRARAGEALPDAGNLLPPRRQLLWMVAVQVGLRSTPVIRRARRLPIQQAVDIAVPLEVAYEEWMRLEFLPEGSRRVEKIERTDDGTLVGRLKGPLWSRRWEAEIRDEREGESFAWRSVKGSDCAGLVTFHQIGERLTRVELQLDVVPVRPGEAIDLAFRLADLRARAELRQFKARLETINPDVYEEDEEARDEDENENEQDDHNDKED